MNQNRHAFHPEITEHYLNIGSAERSAVFMSMLIALVKWLKPVRKAIGEFAPVSRRCNSERRATAASDYRCAA
ncbi:MAG: hypothetical protein DHS20C01_10230 [marine bacterium B5-7]|nr:MAG: hypothetical protein DHS20C01_10230 [marine bacterium B5-7]